MRYIIKKSQFSNEKAPTRLWIHQFGRGYSKKRPKRPIQVIDYFHNLGIVTKTVYEYKYKKMYFKRSENNKNV